MALQTTTVATQWLSSHHVVTPKDTMQQFHCNRETVFSRRSVPRCYKQGTLAVEQSD
jgi:hypothetical protein